MFVRKIRRSAVLGMLAASVLGTVLATSGCGGGGGNSNSDTQTIHTNGTGRVVDVQISPRPGQAFISRNTIFQAVWPGSAPPEFNVGLRRYKEGRGTQDRAIETQKISVNQQNSDPTYNIGRRDGFQLDSNGVYYLELNAPGEVGVATAYIVDESRAFLKNPTRGQQINTSGNGNLSDVQVTPTPGSTFISKGQKFQIRWASGNPPAQFTVDLRRYKEPLGGESRSDEEQKITVDQQGSSPIYNVGRRDNFDLDQGGVYYIAIFAAGQDPYYAVFIVSND